MLTNSDFRDLLKLFEKYDIQLKEFGAPLADLSPDDFMEQGYFYQMGRPPLRIDIMMSIPGSGEAFTECRCLQKGVSGEGLSTRLCVPAREQGIYLETSLDPFGVAGTRSPLCRSQR